PRSLRADGQPRHPRRRRGTDQDHDPRAADRLAQDDDHRTRAGAGRRLQPHAQLLRPVADRRGVRTVRQLPAAPAGGRGPRPEGPGGVSAQVDADEASLAAASADTPSPVQRRAMRDAVASACFGSVAVVAFTNGMLLLLMTALGYSSERIVVYLSLPAIVGAALSVPFG